MASSTRSDKQPQPLQEEHVTAAPEDTTLTLGHAGLASECWPGARAAESDIWCKVMAMPRRPMWRVRLPARPRPRHCPRPSQPAEARITSADSQFQHNHLADRRVKIKLILSHRCPSDLISDPADGVSGSVGIVHDAAKCLPDFSKVWRILIEKIKSCTGVVAHGGDRLHDFVSQRGRQFSHHTHAVHVSEIRLEFAECRSRPCILE